MCVLATAELEDAEEEGSALSMSSGYPITSYQLRRGLISYDNFSLPLCESRLAVLDRFFCIDFAHNPQTNIKVDGHA